MNEKEFTKNYKKILEIKNLILKIDDVDDLMFIALFLNSFIEFKINFMEIK